MGAIGISNAVLNQKGSPAIYTDILANRPVYGFNGRIFISTDTSQIFEDTGTSWNLIADSGVGATGTLEVVTTNGNTTDKGINITSGGLTSNAITQPSFTTGSVLFAGTGGVISQDNANMFYDSVNKFFGIGVNVGVPSTTLDVHSPNNVAQQINATGTNDSKIAFLNQGLSKWRIGNLYAANTNLFHIYNTTAGNNALTIAGNNVSVFASTVQSTGFKVLGGTSSQFLKGDGTLDSSTYVASTFFSASSPLTYNSVTGAFNILQANTSQAGYLSSTDWNTFNSKASLTAFSATSPLFYNSGTGAFTIQVATSGQAGYLTSTDWNTFNNKQAALNFGNLTESTSSVLTISGGTGAVIGSGTTIQIKQASTVQNGYLSSTDFTTFNSKQAQINGLGFVKANGTTISYDNSTYYLASNPNSYVAASYFSALTPLSYNSGTGAFSISQANGSTNGYLSSADWTTFNNKQNALTNPVTGSGSINYVPVFTGASTVGNSLIYSNGSFVGINTNTNAGYTFDVNGTGRFSGALSGTSASFSAALSSKSASVTQTDANSYGSISVIGNSRGGSIDFYANATSVGGIYSDASANLYLYNGNSFENRLTIASTGAARFSNNVSVNTTNAFSTLEIGSVESDGTGSTNAIRIQSKTGASNQQLLIGINQTNTYSFLQSSQASVGYKAIALNPNGGNSLIGSSTDTGQGILQVAGGITGGGISLTGSTYPNSATLNKGYYHVFTGGAGQTLTLPAATSNNYQYLVINNTANTVTLAAASGATIITLLGTSVGSITLLANQRAFVIADGNIKYYQAY